MSRTGISSKEIIPAASTSQWVSSGITGNRLCLLQLLIWSILVLTPVVSLMLHPGRVSVRGAGRLPLAQVPVAAPKMMNTRIVRTNRMSTKLMVTKRLQLGNLSSQLPKHWHVFPGYIEENKRWNDGKCMYRTRGASSNPRQKQLQEIPASDLHLDDRPMSSVGWSGCVVGGTLNGRRVAVKFAPRNSERAEVSWSRVLEMLRAHLKVHYYLV